MSSTRCINALNKAAGRELTADELENVFARISKTARDIAADRAEPAGGPHNTSSPEGIMRAAAELEAQALVEEAERKVRNAYRDVTVAANLRADLATIERGGLNKIEAVRRILVNDADGRANAFSLESSYLGTSQWLKAKIQTTWDALGNDFLGFFQDRTKVRQLIAEMRGEDSGNPLAKKGAEAWLKMAEETRLWFNELGGKIGRLDDWGLPQHHSQDLVSRAAKSNDAATNRAKWVDDIMPLINRDRYTEIDGTPMTDAQVRAFMENAWETIATNGVLKVEPGQFKGGSARSNRGSEERQIHFKDADSTIEYWSKYGDKTLPDILMGHVENIAKNIAFVEKFGSNPDAMYRTLRDAAYQAEVKAAPTNLDKLDGQMSRLDRLYNYASGKTLPVANQSVANAFQVTKNLNAAGKLGSAVYASLFGDKVMFEAIGHVNNLPAFQRWYNEVRLLNPANAAERRQLRRHAMMTEYMGGALARFGEDLGAASFTGKLSTAVLRATGMAAVNEWRRGAWALTAMDTLGHVVSTKDFAQIGKDDMRLLTSYGINAADWQVWKLAKLDDLGHGNNTALTPESIGRIPDAEIAKVIDQRLKDIRSDADAQIAELASRNAQDSAWVKGRLDKFDAARDALNRQVKARHASRLDKNEEATGSMLERMALLDAQREGAKLQADMEADYNKLFTKADVDAFNTGLRSAEQGLASATRGALSAAEKSGRDFGIRKQRIEQKMRDAQKRVANGGDEERALLKMAEQQAELEHASLQNDIEIALKATPEAERAALKSAMNDLKNVRSSSNAGMSSAERIGFRYGEAKGRLERRMQEIQNKIGEMDRKAGRETDADAKAAQKKADAMGDDLREFVARSEARQARRQYIMDKLDAKVEPATQQAINAARREATVKLMGALTSESNLAVIEPGWNDRARMYGGLQRGNVRDELTRSFWQFKAFPIAQFERMLDVGLSRPTLGGKAAFLTAVPVLSTIAGAFMLQVQDLLAGKDPRPMKNWKFWMAAAMKGGSLGLYGDFLYSQSATTRYGTGPLEALAGPTIGAAADITKFAVQAMNNAGEKDTQSAAKALQIAKGFVPGQNMWMTKWATDHLIFQQAQEMLNPGYLSAMQERTAKEFGQDFWLPPGNNFGDTRAPDFSKALE